MNRPGAFADFLKSRSAIFASLVFATILLCLLVFSDPAYFLSSDGALPGVLRYIAGWVLPASTQGLIVGLLGFVALIAVGLLQARPAELAIALTWSDKWLLMFIGSLIAGYCIDSSLSDRNSDALITIAGAVLALWLNVGVKRLLGLYSAGLVFLFAFTGVMLLATVPNVFYLNDNLRWRGVWGQPNTAGTLVAISLIGCLGLLQIFLFRPDSRLRLVSLVGLFAASGILAYGVLRTYSRGAYINVMVGGLMAIVPQVFESIRLKVILSKAMKLVVVTATVVGTSVMLGVGGEVSFYIKRIFSIINSSDLSILNRIAVARALIASVCDHPLFGLGWKAFHEEFSMMYCESRFDGRLAAHTNSLLSLAAIVGLPVFSIFALLCRESICSKAGFGGPISTEHGPQGSAGVDRVIARRTCRGILVAMLIAFAFDGGLFDAPTGLVFWAFLGVNSAI